MNVLADESDLRWTYDASNRLTSETRTDGAHNPVYQTRYTYETPPTTG
ncbi:MAG: hypothetical protein U0670_08700 [Anaerolineae bacterium]